MGASEELFAAVRTRAAGTDFAVLETPGGFEIRVDLDNAQLFGVLRERHLSQISIHHVQVNEAARTLQITDELRTLTWQAGPDGRERPTLGASVEVASGRVETRGFQRTYTLGKGGLTKESEKTFDSSGGRDLVLDAAKPLGWKVEQSLNEKIGLYVGLGTIVLLVLAGIIVGIVALAGGFS